MAKNIVILGVALLVQILSLTLLVQDGLVEASVIKSNKTLPKAFWYPLENGTNTLAYLEGSPKKEVNESDIKFFLYTLKNQDTEQEIQIGELETLKGYIPGATLKIICHGYSSSHLEGPGPILKSAYFNASKNYNVILIDWAPLAEAPDYVQAAANTQVVGEKAGRLISYLVDLGYLTLDQVHFIGHSLGAHVGGFAGNSVGPGNLIGRLTGLDPALPLFSSANASGRIDSSDAKFVDIIHTAGGVLAFIDPLGHVDFFPNGGETQVGCGVDLFGGCSHPRSYAYMAESIGNPDAFPSCKCESWEKFDEKKCACTQKANMGEYVSTSARGNFYLRTNADPPYSQKIEPRVIIDDLAK